MTYQELKETIKEAITEFGKTNKAHSVSVEAIIEFPIIIAPSHEEIEQHNASAMYSFFVTIQ